jgi:hypothetical protein
MHIFYISYGSLVLNTFRLDSFDRDYFNSGSGVFFRNPALFFTVVLSFWLCLNPVSVNASLGGNTGLEANLNVVQRFDEASDESMASRAELSPVGGNRSRYFERLAADPNEVTSHINVVNADSGDSDLGTFTAAFVGVGVSYPLYEEQDSPKKRYGWDISLDSVILSQFNLDRSSDDLLNTDFLVGFPFEYRDENFSSRVRLMHQSSHLGDELLLSGLAPPRVNLSVEFLDVLLARRVGPFRVYGGGKYAFRREPDNLDPGAAQGGLEYRGNSNLLGGKPILAVDYQSFEVTDWESQISARAGIFYPKLGPSLKGLHVLINVFEGPAPFGQFFTREVDYVGIGFYLDL